MFVEKRFQIDRAACKDETRYLLMNINYEPDPSIPERGMLVATNGRILAVVPVDVQEGDVMGLIPAATYAVIRGKMRHERHGPPHPVVVEKDRVFLTTDRLGAKYDRRPDEGTKFPDWRLIVPKEEEQTVMLSLNPTLLMDLARAIGAQDGVTLKMKPDEKGVVLGAVSVKGDAKDGFGVLMPRRP